MPFDCNHLVVVTNEQVQEVRDVYNVTKVSLDISIGNLIEWFKAQPHLPKVKIDREWVERLFILNKCSIDRTKQKLIMKFTSRVTYAEFFQKRDPVKLFKTGKMTVMAVPLPKLTPENKRVIILRCTSDTKNFSLLETISLLIMVNEYRQHHDYSLGDCYICDFRNLSFGHILKSQHRIIKRGEAVNREVFGYRVAAVHLLSGNPIIRYAVATLKMILPSKIGKRIHVCDNVESISKDIPREILPKDYGGDENTLEDINDDWEATMCSDVYQKWMQDEEKNICDEPYDIKNTKVKSSLFSFR